MILFSLRTNLVYACAYFLFVVHISIITINNKKYIFLPAGCFARVFQFFTCVIWCTIWYFLHTRSRAPGVWFFSKSVRVCMPSPNFNHATLVNKKLIITLLFLLAGWLKRIFHSWTNYYELMNWIRFVFYLLVIILIFVCNLLALSIWFLLVVRNTL